MYPKIDEKEKAQVAEVFGLTGGELSDRSMRFAEIKYTPGIPDMAAKGYKGYESKYVIRRWWARYFYDGVPDYVERDFRRMSGSFFTMVRDITFGPPPLHILAQGKIWRRVAHYYGSGETQCPMHDIDPEDVTWDDQGRCPLCEEEKGKEHGYIYLGEGWAEIVYRARD